MLGGDVYYEEWLEDGWFEGTFRPNPFGLHDILGNAYEFCDDRYGSYELGVSPGTGARQTEGGLLGTQRGGAWAQIDFYVRSACRGMVGTVATAVGSGVRPARALD